MSSGSTACQVASKSKPPSPRSARSSSVIGPAGGDVAHLLGVLAPAEADLVVLQAQRLAVRVGLGRRLECLAHRLGVEPDGLLGRALSGRDLHASSSPLPGRVPDYLTWNPCPESRSMSFVRPRMKRPM